MNDKDQEIFKAIALLIKNGYSVSYEAPPSGKIGLGTHLHVIDELKGETNE